ncbi:hypothetical protein BS17DRAFT_809521 [Gyrodon lividus]|nr:hypothetical protein BS17DRAFT_809521 [Gyrodon lividus]
MAKGAPDLVCWTDFLSALQLTINRATHKWTVLLSGAWKDLIENSKPPHGVTRSDIRIFWADPSQASPETLFKDFNIKKNIRFVENMEPRIVARARTVPALESDVKRLRATLKKENLGLFERIKIKKKVQPQHNADEKSAKRYRYINSKWCKLPHDEMGL